jgi:dipeptidyl aminopeptidase/acylaminoacyl peptidase
MSAFSLAALAAASSLASAEPAQLHRYGDLVLSPDGEKIASVDSVEPLAGVSDVHAAIVVRSARDGQVIERIDPCKTCSYSALAWSPDGKTLAFTAGDFATKSAVLEAASGGKTVELAKIQGVAGAVRWSPDGSRLGWLTTPGARKRAGAVEAGAPQVGEIGTDFAEQRIAVVPAAGGEPKLESPADTYVYEFDWTPDGKGFVATAAKGNGDDNWWTAKLEAFDAATGAERVIASPAFQMNVPRVSPDGKNVLVIGGLMSDFGSVGGDLWSVPLAGGEPVDLTAGFKGTFNSYVVRGSKVLATALVGDRAEAIELDPATRAMRVLWSAPLSVAAGDGRVAFSRDGAKAATVAQDFEHGPRVLSGPIDALAQVTHDNDALSTSVEAKSVSWTSEGFNVQGWLLGPKTVEPGKTYPMIVLVHGGPSAAVTPSFVGPGTVRDLVEHGYYVFQPNPRGSYGQGEAFTRANMRDFGRGDFRDILAGVDAVEKAAPIDDARLGIYGHSYGGFMTMWAVANSHRFHAAVAGAGLANWISYYGENGIDKWMIPFFGASAYDDPQIYWDLSPLKTIKTATTPTFIYVGERDLECPAPQSVEFWHGLKEFGVPTTLMIYPGEGHGLRSPEHRKDLEDRIVGWFDKYLK